MFSCHAAADKIASAQGSIWKFFSKKIRKQLSRSSQGQIYSLLVTHVRQFLIGSFPVTERTDRRTGTCTRTYWNNTQFTQQWSAANK